MLAEIMRQPCHRWRKTFLESPLIEFNPEKVHLGGADLICGEDDSTNFNKNLIFKKFGYNAPPELKSLTG
jgi:hypothetical protein